MIIRMAFTEFKLYLREPASVAATLGLPLLIVVSFGLLINPGTDTSSLVTYFPGMAIAFSLAILSLNLLPTILANYREKGILRRLSTTPVPPASLLLAQVAVSFAVALAMTLIVVVVGHFVIGFTVPAQLGGFLLAFVLGTLSLFAVGLVIAAIAPSGRAATGIGMLVFFLNMFAGGVFTPRETLPDFLNRIGDFLPLGAALTAMRDAWSGSFPQPLHLLVMATITVVFGLAAAGLFRWE
ncbi:ABC transporter permease [Kutzneria albida]|uniref:Transport permease protein n=1 Tax=Kutzneria albida DSM 43870 TaxID=1449976 RepID=W5W5S2_9PSEU|nr:ABC transporter permease [Kutzneria albida]AHH95826.1 ABC-2 type transporter [Kutzneria albida DSM 43870]